MRRDIDTTLHPYEMLPDSIVETFKKIDKAFKSLPSMELIDNNLVPKSKP